jgi:CRP-like cAMP-binding protein
MSRSISDADRALFTRAVRALSPLDDAEVGAGLAVFRPRALARGAALLRAGERATEVSVVMQGLLREHFVSPRGVERTKAFVLEGQSTGSLADLVSGAPSRAFIVADEPSRLLVARFTEVRALSARFARWAALERAALERTLLVKAEREWELLGLDAEARYAVFRRRFPGLEARVAARHVASYLGITPVHLSRLRRRSRPARAR